MEKILFVDENQDVLGGFRRVLYKMRKQWDMEFVTNGSEALKLMEKSSYSAVVSDAGMAGITGIELMQKVRNLHPQTARIILSGNADLKELLEGFGTAHQFLVKPVAATLLKDTLLRVTSLLNHLQDDSLKRIVNRLQSLPSPPELHLEFLKASTTGSIKEIGMAIEKDPAMTIKILQLVNSPYLGVKQRIRDIYHAVVLLGVDVLKGLVLSIETFSRFRLNGSSQMELHEIFNHSCDVANYARLIAFDVTGDRELANDAYTGGLVHDIGKLILLEHFNKEYFLIKQNVADHDQSFCQTETEILGINHALLGAYLLGLWGLPESLVETVAYHHNPSRYYRKDFSPALAVHIANIVKRNQFTGMKMVEDFGISTEEGDGQSGKTNLIEKVPDAVSKIHRMKELQFF